MLGLAEEKVSNPRSVRNHTLGGLGQVIVSQLKNKISHIEKKEIKKILRIEGAI